MANENMREDTEEVTSIGNEWSILHTKPTWIWNLSDDEIEDLGRYINSEEHEKFVNELAEELRSV